MNTTTAQTQANKLHQVGVELIGQHAAGEVAATNAHFDGNK